MNLVYLLIGSNEGDRLKLLALACKLLEEKAGNLINYSSIFETESWGIEDLPPHYNQALLLQTEMNAEDLLKIIHEIEHELGRKRQIKWGLRSIDIDIIYFNSEIINTTNLTIPHALMQERNFVLAPLVEIAPDFIHPVFLKTNEELLGLSKDKLSVKEVSSAAS